MSAAGGDATPVTIFGRTYQLRGSEDSEYLAHLAKLVDRAMREVHQATGTSDTLKVAILACLNIADEQMQAGRAGSASRVGHQAESRLVSLVEQLDEVLVE